MARPALEPGQHGRITFGPQGADGSWTAFVLVCDAHGAISRKSAKRTTKGAAERALKAKLQHWTGSAATGALTADSKMHELLTYWSAQLDRKGLARSTVVTYREAAALICAELRPAPDPSKAKHVARAKRDREAVRSIGQLRIRQFTGQALAELLQAVEDRHGATRARLVGVVVKAALDYAVRFGAADYNVAKLAEPVRKSTPEVRALSPEELRALLADLWADPRAKAADLPRAVELLAVTGLRTGELFALRWQDLQLGDIPTVTVSGTAVRLGGLRRQDHPKSESSRRTVRIPSSTAAWLMDRRIETASEWVMPSSTGTMRDPGNFRTALRAFTGRHQRWEWVVPRTLRKTTATVIRDELGIEAASHQLGHSGVAVTETHYAQRVRVGPDVAELLGAMLTGPTDENSQ